MALSNDTRKGVTPTTITHQGRQRRPFQQWEQRRTATAASKLLVATACAGLVISACSYAPLQAGAVLNNGGRHAHWQQRAVPDRQHGPRALPVTTTTAGVDTNHFNWRRQGNNTAGNGGGGGVTVSIPGAGGGDGSDTTTSASSTSSTSSTTSNAPTTSGTTTSDTSATNSQQTTSGDTTSSTSSTTQTVPTTSDTTTSQTTDSTTVSDVVQTTVITTTLSNGSVMTTPVPTTSSANDGQDNNNNNDNTSNSKAWIIPLSVVGGIVVLAGLLFIGYRFSQRRFSELDDDDGNGIRWPELMQRHGEEATTLNPLATKRREGAGFDMDEGKSVSQLSLTGGGGGGGSIGMTMDGASSVNVGNSGRVTPIPSHAEVFAAAGLGAPGMAIARSNSSQGSSQHAANGAYYQGPNNGYYDPYLGASGAPYPPPPRVMSPNQGYYDPYQENTDYVPPSPYYPPPAARSNAATSGRSSPFQAGQAGVPIIAPPLDQAYDGAALPPQQYHHEGHGNNAVYGGEYEDAYHPNLDPPLSPLSSSPTQHSQQQQQQQQQQQHALGIPRVGSPPQLPAPPVVRPMRLSIANPDDLVDDR